MPNLPTESDFQQCGYGHYYDAAKQSDCPFCAQRAAESADETVPAEPLTQPDLPVQEPIAPVVPEPIEVKPFKPDIAVAPKPMAQNRSSLPLFLFLILIALIGLGGAFFSSHSSLVKKFFSKISAADSDKRPAILSFQADPRQIEAGETAILRWTTTDATTLEIDQNVGVVTGQEIAVSPTTTTVYTLTASNHGSLVTRSAVVSVQEKAALSPSISFFSVTPVTADPSQPVELQWSVSGATNLSIDNGVGEVTGSDKVVTPAGTTTYTLTAQNSAGSVTRTVTVTVHQPPPPIPRVAVESFSATPDRIERGQSTVLHWSVKNAVAVNIDNGVGMVEGDQISLRPSATTHYTLTAIGTANTETKSVDVEVTQPPPPPVKPALLQQGELHCSGVAIPPNGKVTFENLPLGRLSFTVDPTGAWKILVERQNGSQKITLISQLRTIQTSCTVHWKLLP